MSAVCSEAIAIARRTRPRVYLAGPMKGLSVFEATAWRAEVIRGLAPEIVCYSPMRQVVECAGDGRVQAEYENHILHNARSLTARDRNDVKTADLVMVYLVGAANVSIGSVMEIAWSDAWRIPTVLVAEPGDLHDHPMIRESVGWIVPTLDDAIYVARSVLLP